MTAADREQVRLCWLEIARVKHEQRAAKKLARAQAMWERNKDAQVLRFQSVEAARAS